MANISPTLLSDRDLLDATAHAVDRERRTTAELLALLAELDARKLFGEGYSSLFTYCTQALHLSEPAAYSRITAARAARRYPMIFTRLAEGAMTLTTIGLLAAHLTDEHHDAWLDAARHRSKREVEHLVASLYPQPDIPSSVRKMGAPPRVSGPALLGINAASVTEAAIAAPTVVLTETPTVALPITPAAPSVAAASAPSPVAACPLVAPDATPPSQRSILAPLAPERYLLRVTLSRDAHDKLERAQALLRHAIPNGDPAAVVDRALTALLGQLEKRRMAVTSRPRNHASQAPRTRHVPAAVKRAVWTRDQGRCAFVGAHGRCNETAFAEFHHVRPFAVGGATDVDNLQLRCRAHNAHEAACYFGEKLWAPSMHGDGREGAEGGTNSGRLNSVRPELRGCGLARCAAPGGCGPERCSDTCDDPPKPSAQAELPSSAPDLEAREVAPSR